MKFDGRFHIGGELRDAGNSLGNAINDPRDCLDIGD